jgi:hypothetical protein
MIASDDVPVKLSNLRQFTKEITEREGWVFDFSFFESLRDPENWWLELLYN